MSSFFRSQWYYHLQNDPHGRTDGWYRYEATIEQTIENLYQNYVTRHTNARQLLPTTASSGYQYEVDFQAMTQRNTTTSKTRPIGRTTNGRAPPTGGGAPSTFVAAPASGFLSTMPAVPPPAVPAAAIPVAAAVYQPPPSFAPHFVPSAPSAPTAAVPPRLAGVNATRQPLANGGEQINYTAPNVLHEVCLDESKIYQEVKVTRSATSNSHDDECCICLDPLFQSAHDRVVAIKSCSHKFHYTCIHEALTKGGAKCPLCSKAVEQDTAGTKTKTCIGKCPDATMSYHVISKDCQGFRSTGTIEITYEIPSGVQKSYHSHPGDPFHGTTRIAYVPATIEGWNILWRMQYAFAHGLMFMVGTSLTTAQPNVVTWASIHNKTSMSGGTFGYPDDTYFDRSHDEMDQKGIPNAAECRAWIAGL